MDIAEEPTTKHQGKLKAILVGWFLGVGTLVSWNSMLTIQDYYYILFSDCHPSRVLTLVYQPFALGTIALLAYNEAEINTRKRIIAGYILFTATTLMLLLVTTGGKGGIGPYIGICVIIALFGVADAHVPGGLTGDLSFMCPEFLQSFYAGLAASGAMTAGLRLITKASFNNAWDGLRKGVMLFLAISTFMEFLCIILYAVYFLKLPIVKYYRAKAASKGSKTVSGDLVAAGIHISELLLQSQDDSNQIQRSSTNELLLQNIDLAMDMFLIHVLTLSIIPGFLYEITGQHKLGTWYALVLVVMYNCWDLIGRYIPLRECMKLESRKWIMVAILSRFILIPAFYFTAKYGDQGWMIMLISFLGITNGYITVCVVTVAPKGYKGPEANALGNLLVVFLLGGMFAGVALDWLWLIGNEKF